LLLDEERAATLFISTQQQMNDGKQSIPTQEIAG
jgi:hypothetical protein